MKRKSCTFGELVSRHIDSRDDIFAKVAVYPFALPLAWVLLNFTSVTANAVTIAGLALGTAGALATFFTLQPWYLLGGFCSFYVCDFVDGQVASVRGGSQLGALLDLVADRTVLFLSLFCLALIHFSADQSYELLLLLCFVMTFAYLDALFLAKYSAARNQAASAAASAGATPQSTRGFVFSIWTLFPARLSSPLFFLAVLGLTESYAIAYYFAIGCVLSEYTTLTLKAGMRLRNRLRPGLAVDHHRSATTVQIV